MNTGHGHVRLREDGVKARCGGPGICSECSIEFARTHKQTEPDILDQLRDLVRQATVERSHFYVGSVVRNAIAEIERLRA